jgi:peptide/nickel transport system permease protein
MKRRGEIVRLAGNAALVIGLAGTIALLVIGVFGEALVPHDPNAQQWLFVSVDAKGQQVLRFAPTTPDADHLLGTDQLGRDQFSRLLAGARITLTTVLAAVMVRLVVGVGLGLIAGWYGGLLERGARILVGAFAAVPQLLLAILFILVLRSYGFAGFIAAVALVGWPEIEQFAHAEVARVRVAPFVEAARAIGSRGPSLLRRHLLRVLAPQLLSVAALESGAVLLLLAELGLVGLFVAGAVYYVDDAGLPVLPLRDRAPEWAQMLAGIQFYVPQEQLVVLIPAVFVVLAVVVFTLLAEGLRSASDPYGSHTLLPRTFGRIGAAVAVVFLASAVGLLGLNVRPAAMSFEEGRALARGSADRTWPGSEYVAAVVRFSSQAHGMERPEKLTYYFRDRGGGILRVSFLDGDRLKQEVRPNESEDELDFTTLRPLPDIAPDYGRVLAKADGSGGAAWRLRAPTYFVRAILSWSNVARSLTPGRAASGEQSGPFEVPTVSVTYGTLAQSVTLAFCCYDPESAKFIVTRERIPQPFAVPAECRDLVTRFEPDERAGLVGYFVESPGLVIGTPLNLFFEGGNFLHVERAPTTPMLASAVNTTHPGAQARLAFAQAMGSGAYAATLDFNAPGCWHVRIAAETAAIDLVIYAYPEGCRPHDPRIPTRPCEPP